MPYMRTDAAIDDESEITSRRSETLGRPQLGGGRLGTYTALGAVTGIVPLPWIPDAIVRRVRGALIHDITSRHGLSLTPEARTILIEPGGGTASSFFKQGVAFAVTRVLGRLGPLVLLNPVRTALGTFVLGHLLQRYLDTVRIDRTVRIDVDEARRIRRAIDQALLDALTTPGRGLQTSMLSPDDLRDQTTRIVDGVLIAFASAPEWLQRRLEAAFDETIITGRRDTAKRA